MGRNVVAQAKAEFRKRFKRSPAGVSLAPGRVNIIGEHTDYNDGFVLPAAVDLATAVAFAPRGDGTSRIYSDAEGEEVSFQYALTAKDGLPFWARYAWGVGMSLLERGITPDAVDGYVASTVPQAGGLSSSASFEVALALAYLNRRARRVKKLDLARIARRAENRYVGTNCGIMDQYACVFGREGRAVLLDCRSLVGKLIPFPAKMALVVADTTVRRALGESGYHKRQEECATAARVMSESEAGVKNLRDVTLEMLEKRKGILGETVFRRARHVVTENGRVIEASSAMRKGDAVRLGGLMRESHRSLRDDFEVSCRELDLMVGAAVGINGHYGTRMTGGGFGGCTVSLVEKGKAAQFAAELARRYGKATGLEAAVHVVRPGRGAELKSGGR